MTSVITDQCIKCKHMDCVEVCCVDAFYEGENMLVINPLECVDCGVCIEECPVDAIVFDSNPLAEPWLELNAKYSKIWPNVTSKNEQTPPDAAEFASEPGKFERYFSPKPGKGDFFNRQAEAARTGGCSRCEKEAAVPRLLRWIRKFWS